MTAQEKQALSRALEVYMERKALSLTKTATILGVGRTTLSLILNGDPDGKVSDEMYRLVDAKTRPTAHKEWNVVETTLYCEISGVLNDAQTTAGCTWIIADAGSGKSTTARHYAQATPNAFYVLCSDMVRGEFISQIAQAVGVRSLEGSLCYKFNQLMYHIETLSNPLLIFDEADKLSDNVFYYFIELYNQLEGRCGLVFLSTDSIEGRFRRGLRYNKRGYNELHSRLGRKFYRAERTTLQDVYAVCKGNGIDNDSLIHNIAKDATQYDLDLRRVKKRIIASSKH